MLRPLVIFFVYLQKIDELGLHLGNCNSFHCARFAPTLRHEKDKDLYRMKYLNVKKALHQADIEVGPVPGDPRF